VEILVKYPWSLWVMQSFRGEEGTMTPQELLDWYCPLILRCPFLCIRRMFTVTEPHKSGRLHLHMLWKCSLHSCADWRIIKEYLWSMFGKAYVKPFVGEKTLRASVAYAVKYALKGGRRCHWTARSTLEWGNERSMLWQR